MGPKSSSAVAYTEAFSEGNAFQESGLLTEAIACYDRAIAIKSDSLEAYRNRGNALRELGRLAEAVDSYERALAIRPNISCYINHGNTLRALKRTEEALQSYDCAITLNPHFAEIHNNRGSALQELGRFEEAVASYERAVALKPAYAQGHNNLGVALGKLRRFDEAIAAFDRAIALRSDYAEAVWNRGLTRLLLGDYSSGWRDYEARKQKRGPVGDRRYTQPVWLGDAPVSGKTILVHWEQGFGDTIQFSRYIRLLADAGAQVLFAPQRPLKGLMETLGAQVRIVDIDAPLPAFDLHCPLLSLPLAFGTEPHTVPGAERYLQVDRAKAAAFNAALGARTRPRIGVAWSGSLEPDSARSIPLRTFATLFEDHCQFISLQKDVGFEDRAWLTAANVVHLGDELEDFTDTAAACSLMDLVICIDTALAHLAGALGIPVWVLLRHVPDWRWMLDRPDTPWYSSMKLIRQPQRDDWEGALRQARAELSSRFGSPA